MKLLEITVAVPCKNKCSYCPQDLLNSRYKGTPVLTLKKFEQLLANIPTDVVLVFAGYCEPFQNQECADMILLAHKRGYKIKVFTTLVGFTKSDADKTKDIPFERFYVHDIGQPKDYLFITDSMTDEEYKPFLTSRAGVLREVPRKQYFRGCNAQGSCSDAVVVPNGDLYCCMDYGLTRKLGNLFIINFNDIPKLTEFELCHYCELNN